MGEVLNRKPRKIKLENSSPKDIYSREELKNNGIFYTPKFLAEYFIKKTISYYGVSTDIKTVADPACGDSILLRSFAQELIDSESESKPLFLGFDKDKEAIAVSSNKFNVEELNKFETKFIKTDALFPVKKKTPIKGWNDMRRRLNIKNGFDIIVSNPPWGAELNGYSDGVLSSNFSLAKGQFDVYDLFVEIILNNLKEGGIYGLILPDSIFSQEQIELRHLLSKNTSLQLVARLGEKIFPEIHRACVIIIGKNSLPEESHLVDCFRLSSDYKNRIISNELSFEMAESKLIHKVPQKRFSENANYLFDIDLKTSELETFNKIVESSSCLKNYTYSTRGAEISKKGIVCQCSNCDYWMPYPKLKSPTCNNCKSSLQMDNILVEKIIMDTKSKGTSRFKAGEDLYRFTSISKRWIDTSKKGINYKPLNIYQGDKVLVRKTGVGVTASMDYANAVTNQVVYILKLNEPYLDKLTLEFVLAVLNSRVITYFLIKKYGENEWRSHPYLTQTILSELPFPNIDFSQEETKTLIEDLTSAIRKEVKGSKKKNISFKTDLFIEQTVAKLYGLNEGDYIKIFETLNSSDQLIPIKRLLNLNTNDIFNTNGV